MSSSRLKLLIAIPCEETLDSRLHNKMVYLAMAMMNCEAVRERFTLSLAIHYNRGRGLPGLARWQDAAKARNALARDYLKDNDIVLWMDADIVDYPPELPVLLWDANPGGITAPAVLVEGTNQFYDTYCFVEHGQRVSHTPPYFTSQKTVVEMDCVGSCYIMPANLLCGFKFEASDLLADHGGLMKRARDAGVRICCAREVTVWHAMLPKYNLRWH